MKYYDVFNGDADGILSLVQLRQVDPKDSELITGVKRDIELVKKVPAEEEGKQVTILDISMEKNKAALNQLLSSGCEVFYADHHRAGDIPLSHNLSAHIDLDADTCTALIIDKLLQGKKHLWAITATYGDNLIAKADALAEQVGLSKEQMQQLRELGTLVNYNGYGESLADLHFDPAELYRLLVKYNSPFDCIEDISSPFHTLQQAYLRDHEKAKSAKVIAEQGSLLAIELEDEAWARRISGVYGNELANQFPDKAVLVLTKNQDESFRVSLRAPINNKQGAGEICSQFDTGGGRAAAAGINKLANSELPRLIDTIVQYY